MNRLVLRQPMTWTFLLHESATTYQTYSNSVPKFKLKSLVLNVLKAHCRGCDWLVVM